MKVSVITQYKAKLYESLSKELSDFEKNFLLISGAVLTFSLTFIKDIINIQSASCLCLLLLSWILMIVSIAMMMYSFLYSAKSSNKLWKNSDDFINNNNLFNEDTDLTESQVLQYKQDRLLIFNESISFLSCLRNWAVVFFIISISSLSCFVSINLLNENKNKFPKTTINYFASSKQDSILILTKDTDYLIKFKLDSIN